MIREKVFKPKPQRVEPYKWRNHEIFRIEAFSDAIFAFALTLTIISLEVPSTFHQLAESMLGMVGFLICFVFIFTIWFHQYRYFRYFGLRDTKTLFLNAGLIFVLLFYVYPLKFLVSLITSGNQVMEHGELVNRFESVEDTRSLMIIYSAGLVAIYVMLFLMYKHAKSKSKEIHLSSIEQYNLNTNLFEYGIMIAVGCISIVLALVIPSRLSGLAGIIYSILGPAYGMMFTWRRKKMLKLFTSAELEHHNVLARNSKKSVHELSRQE